MHVGTRGGRGGIAPHFKSFYGFQFSYTFLMLYFISLSKLILVLSGMVRASASNSFILKVSNVFPNGIMALVVVALEIFMKRSNRTVSTSGGLFAFPFRRQESR